MNLLLVTSLAVTPVYVVLATAMDTSSEHPAQSAATEPCHQSVHEQTATNRQVETTMMPPPKAVAVIIASALMTSGVTIKLPHPYTHCQ
ncbi:MAG: hypothetical protein KAJ06_06580 [Gammaproteobacteria bacterium]|nr:hypothetical protein [Gammaproteobacteria bacterium]